MKNELALNGEKISQKIYPALIENIGMIRGEYIIREINKSILCIETQNKIREYLDNICRIYNDEQVWYRFAELTNTEMNNLEGTVIKLADRHPLMGARGIRRLLMVKEEFYLELSAINKVYENNKNLAIFFPFVNNSKQLMEAIKIIKKTNKTIKIGCMVELPSAYFDLDNILNTGISKIVIGMNDLTSFIFATTRDSEWHDMEGDIMLNIIKSVNEKCLAKNIEFAVAGYLRKSIVKKLNALGIKCIIHYNLIPCIYNKKIEFANHLNEIKEKSKEIIKINEDNKD